VVYFNTFSSGSSFEGRSVVITVTLGNLHEPGRHIFIITIAGGEFLERETE